MIKTSLRYASVITPLGTLYLAKSPKGICRVALGERDKFLRELKGRFKEAPILDDSSFSEIIKLFRSYFKGEKVEFKMSIDLQGLTRFQRSVLLEVKKIPYGKLKTYGEIADLIGQPKAPRAVGQALSRNPFFILIPCHRVILKSGGLGGFGYGVEMKERLLKLENSWPL